MNDLVTRYYKSWTVYILKLILLLIIYKKSVTKQTLLLLE